MTSAARSGFAVSIAALAVAYAVVLYVAAPAWPDDWDGVGFLLAMRGFDLAAFRPHAPGYPAYVALLDAAALACGPTMRAAALVGAISGAATMLAAARALHLLGGRASALSVLLLAVTPMVVHASSGVGSEAPALAWYAVGWWAVASYDRATRPKLVSLALGLSVALGLGTRLSWAPLYLPLLLFPPRREIRAALLAFAAGLLGWLVPFVALVGASHLVALVRAQASGHFTRWGGSELTDPGAARLFFFSRDLLVDGLGAGGDAFGVAAWLVIIAVASAGLTAWREARFVHAGRVALVVLPYALWVLLGQNVAGQPRHLLPLVALAAVALAETARRVSRIQIAGVALAILFASRAAIDAGDRRVIPPAAVQMLAAVAALPTPGGSVLFAGASARFAEILSLASTRVLPAASMGDVELAEGRLDHPPPTLLVSSEIEGAKSAAGAATPGTAGTFCRPERLDRRAPCLTLFRIPLR